MTNARDKANIPVLNFQSKGIDDNADATAITIDSSENVGIGTSSPEQALHIQSDSGIRAERFANNGGSANLDLRKSRNATVGSHTILQNGDSVGGIIFRGSDGTAFEKSSAIFAQVDGTPGTDDMPGRLTFWTTPDGTNNYLERMRITSAGLVGIGTSTPTHNLTVDGGTSTSVSLIKDATGSATVRYYDGGSQKSYIQLTADENMDFYAASGVDQIFYGNGAEVMRLSSGVVFNEGGGDRDFRVESNNNDHMLFVDGGNDRVGIGTASPDDKFHVMRGDSGGTARGGSVITAENSGNCFVTFLGASTSNCTLFLGDNINNNAGQLDYDHANDSMSFYTNQSEKVRISSAGLVGIGTSSPSERLDSRGSAVFSGDHATSTNAYGTAHGILLSSTSNLGKITAISNGSNDVKLELRGLDGGNANSNQLVLDGGTSNVGIGTSSPSEKLEVNGTVKATAFEGAGRVLQVIQTVKTDAFTTTSTSMTDITGFSVSITPRSTSSKILVMVNVSMLSNNGGWGSLINLLRDSTNLTSSSIGGSADTYNAWNVGGGGGMSNNERKYNSPSISFLDSPSSTSSLTYKCQLQVNGGSTTAYFNRWGLNTDHAGVSTITVMEIQG